MIWLLAWAAFTRLPLILSGIIPFSFDHGRDSLAVLHLIKTLNPVFLGPWTSIPGLFFGPGWYYLLAPAYWLTQGSPLAGPLTMFSLSLIGIILAYKYLGVYEAIILATAPLWLQLATGAANPFPMTLVGLLLVIALKKGWNSLWLGLILGLGFHFSSALAILWLLVIPWLVKPKHWLKLLAGLFITFIPQLLFELKHNFSQTQAVISYFTAGESQSITPGKIAIVTQSIIHELNLAILPDVPWLAGLGVLIIAAGMRLWPKIGALIVIPLIGFWWLHYNPWYAYGLAPLAVVLVGKVLRALPRPIAWIYCLLLLIGSAFRKNPDLLTYKAFLPAKLTAINYIYNQSGGQPFASYHYLPEIYDYAYQYLYIWQAFRGRPLPVEFSYQPNAPAYINEKADLLSRLPSPAGAAQMIFLIIEKPDNVWHYPFDSWLKLINFSEVVDKKIIGPELEVWQVTP